ncbi:MAG: Dabb family protein [Victivallaceae bacterium]|nr:Dabb family protein [Victivallaceae bacterium]
MTRHVVMWKLKSSIAPGEKPAILAGIREGLESLSGRIPGLVSIKVHFPGVNNSSADAMLETVFTAAAAAAAYRKNPLHVAVAESRVRPFVESRLGFDFEE